MYYQYITVVSAVLVFFNIEHPRFYILRTAQDNQQYSNKYLVKFHGYQVFCTSYGNWSDLVLSHRHILFSVAQPKGRGMCSVFHNITKKPAKIYVTDLGTDHVLVYFVVACTFVWYNAMLILFHYHLLIPVICRYTILLYQQF
jgi:hypothetical protein